MTTKQRYERNELIEWVNLIEEAKSDGLTPEEVRGYIKKRKVLEAWDQYFEEVSK
jgi:hypothetical protein